MNFYQYLSLVVHRFLKISNCGSLATKVSVDVPAVFSIIKLVVNMATGKVNSRQDEEETMARLTTLSLVSGMLTHLINSSTPVVCRTNTSKMLIIKSLYKEKRREEAFACHRVATIQRSTTNCLV